MSDSESPAGEPEPNYQELLEAARRYAKPIIDDILIRKAVQLSHGVADPALLRELLR